jgi:hypothetical protein
VVVARALCCGRDRQARSRTVRVRWKPDVIHNAVILPDIRAGPPIAGRSSSRILHREAGRFNSVAREATTGTEGIGSG